MCRHTDKHVFGHRTPRFQDSGDPIAAKAAREATRPGAQGDSGDPIAPKAAREAALQVIAQSNTRAHINIMRAQFIKRLFIDVTF